jgi:hypothetical protein
VKGRKAYLKEKTLHDSWVGNLFNPYQPNLAVGEEKGTL